jgi:hypothetical protein
MDSWVDEGSRRSGSVGFKTSVDMFSVSSDNRIGNLGNEEGVYVGWSECDWPSSDNHLSFNTTSLVAMVESATESPHYVLKYPTSNVGIVDYTWT